MMNSAFARLVWKDTLLIRPLVLLIVVSAIASNAMIAVLHVSNYVSPLNLTQLATTLWTLLPSLLAFGAPALMVATEEENGTLNWLRTLALRRRDVIWAKLLVAIASLVAAWTVSTLALNLVLQFLPERYTGTTDTVLNQLTVGYLNIQLLLVGFVSSYLFRSPIVGLVAVVPLMIGLLLLDGWVAWELFKTHQSVVPMVIAAITGLLLLAWLQYRLGQSRLSPAHGYSYESLSRYPLPMIRCSTARSESDCRVSLELRFPIPRFAIAAKTMWSTEREAYLKSWREVLGWYGGQNDAGPISANADFLIEILREHANQDSARL